MSAIKIKKSLGKHGENLPADVKTIRKALNALNTAPEWGKDPENGEMNAKTQKALESFLSSALSMAPETLCRLARKRSRRFTGPCLHA